MVPTYQQCSVTKGCSTDLQKQRIKWLRKAQAYSQEDCCGTPCKHT